MKFKNLADKFETGGAKLSKIAIRDWKTNEVVYMVTVSFYVPVIGAEFTLPFNGIHDLQGEPDLAAFAAAFEQYMASGACKKRAEQFCTAYRGRHYSLAPAEIETAAAEIMSKLRELAGAARALENNSKRENEGGTLAAVGVPSLFLRKIRP